MKAKILGLLAVGLLAGQAHALSYSEPPDLGDSPGFPTALGNLSLGANTISGSIVQSGCGERCFNEDFDYYTVNLLAGQELASITVTISNFLGGSPGRFDLIDLAPGGVTLWGNNNITGNGTFNLISFGNSPGPSTLWGRNIFTSSTDGSMNYLLTFNVRAATAAVPEPGTLALLGLGLAGLGLSRRRKAD